MQGRQVREQPVAAAGLHNTEETAAASKRKAAFALCLHAPTSFNMDVPLRAHGARKGV